MTTINFNNQPTIIITIKEFEKLMNSINLNFYGFLYMSISDRDTFEEKTNMSFENLKNGNVKLHDLNYDWE